MKRILFVFTGGTISMKLDAAGMAVPALSGHEVLDFVPDLDTICEPEVVDYGRLPGPHVTPAKMWEISEIVRQQLARPEIAGAVITHGTDTLEETAYFLDLRHESDKPIVLTGAMRNSSELSFDGPANLRAAARVACAEESRSKGVLIVLNQTIHAAAEAVKMDTQAPETFQSPIFGALGIVDNDRVIFARAPLQRTLIAPSKHEPRVDLILMYAGAVGNFIEFSRELGAYGIVLAGTGRGNVPPQAISAIQHALDAGITVVMASRCPQGRILDVYGYEGSGRDLRKRGVLFSGMLSPQKARIRLMLALGKTTNPLEIRELIEGGGYSRV